MTLYRLGSGCRRSVTTVWCHSLKRGCLVSKHRDPSEKDLTPYKSVNQTVKAQDIKTPMLERMVLACPEKSQPYFRLMRFERPVGTWLTLLPGLWGLAIATPGGSLPDLELMALFGAGAFLMRGFGCTVNDMWDKNIDKQVERTKSRPLAANKLSRYDALWFAGAQAGLACVILLQLNWHSVMLGCASVAPVVIYPLMKRFTYWPQACLGLVFNWGTILGISAVQGPAMSWAVGLPLYAAAFCWTMVYDTIYAHQDKLDDILVGTKSTALRFGENTALWLGGFGATMFTGLITVGLVSDQTWPYYLAVVASSGLLARQIATLDIDNPKDCAQKFVANRNIGLLILAGCITGTLLKYS